jgi:hypothetical protein
VRERSTGILSDRLKAKINKEGKPFGWISRFVGLTSHGMQSETNLCTNSGGAGFPVYPSAVNAI